MLPIENFSFVIEGQLAGCAVLDDDCLAEQLRHLRGKGIRAIITLTTFPLDQRKVSEAGMKYLHLPVEDFEPLTRDQYLTGVRFIQAMLAADTAVVVHCLAGMGRTGCLLAAYFVLARGLPAAKAIEAVRAKRPGSIQTHQQELSLMALEGQRL
eukprot:GGOE01013771.1.p3 GENE.GGOE01013771.1~~GGOE01013771.1.p3  ORF type:complete len:154 (+),score=45.94 GGOE01013771.1:69-530(+)